MATAHVQTKTALGSGSTSLGVSLTGVGAGNHLLAENVAYHSTDPTQTLATSTPSATWHNAIPEISLNPVVGFGGVAALRVDYTEGVASGSWTVNVNCTTASSVTAVASESSGVATSGSIGATNHGAANAGGDTNLQTGSITPTSGSIVYAFVMDDTIANNTQPATIDSSFTVASDPLGGAGTSWDNGSNLPGGDAFKANVAASPLNPKWTAPTACNGMLAAIVEFLAPSSGAPVGRLVSPMQNTQGLVALSAVRQSLPW